MLTQRRGLLGAAAVGAVLAAGACARPSDKDHVSASEAVMRDHGVVRRILVVYREAAALIRANFSSVDGRPIWRAADLLRRFAEAYHEPLEETQIFPAVMRAGGAAAALVPTLIAQHARGRQITAYVQARTVSGAVAGMDAEPLAAALESAARMFEAHEAYEDTLILPAWRAALTGKQFEDAASQFAAIETAAFKGDGFAQAVAEVGAIEAALRINDPGRYTADAPGAAALGVLPAPPQLQEAPD
jgi:hemerythrin-like domain-containing protein